MKYAKYIAIFVGFFCLSLPSFAAEPSEAWQLNLKAGYSLGATTPIGLPPQIRALGSMNPGFSFQAGALAGRKLGNVPWGVESGLLLERKGMRTDAVVKSYSMTMTQGAESISGRFTGNVVTEVHQLSLTLPLHATFQPLNNFQVYAGPYLSVLLSRYFGGYAYDGYLRIGDPTGNKLVLGSDEGQRGDYDFSENMRPLQGGIDLGAQWYFIPAMGLYANLAWGFTGIFESGFKTVEQTLFPIYFTLGLVWRIAL